MNRPRGRAVWGPGRTPLQRLVHQLPGAFEVLAWLDNSVPGARGRLRWLVGPGYVRAPAFVRSGVLPADIEATLHRLTDALEQVTERLAEVERRLPPN